MRSGQKEQRLQSRGAGERPEHEALGCTWTDRRWDPRGWGRPFLESSPGSLWRILALEELQVETDPSVGVGWPLQIFAQWVGASEASQHRPSQPGNQALTHNPSCASTLVLLRGLCRGAKRGDWECPRAPVAGAACPWAGNPFLALPMEGRGLHPPTPHPRQELRSPEYGSPEALSTGAQPGQSPPPPLGSRGWQPLSTHSSFSWRLSSATRVQERAGGSVGEGPPSAGPAECENCVVRGCLWTRPAPGRPWLGRCTLLTR